MATKAAKSITINATKYILANTLAVADGKIQLKANDVVLSEIAIPTPTLPPATIKLMTVGVDFGSYGNTDILSYSDVFTGTGAAIEINEEKLAAGTLPVIYLIEDSSDPTYIHADDRTLYPIRFMVSLHGDANTKFVGKDLYDAISQAVAAYKESPNDYNGISITVEYLAGIYAETGHGLQGADNIVTVAIRFNVSNGTVAYSSASASLIDNQYNA